MLWSPLLKEGGCIGAAGPGAELSIYDDCTTAAATATAEGSAVAAEGGPIMKGFSYDVSTGRFRNGDLCVTAELNGTHTPPGGGGGGGGKGGDDDGYLFNVVEDPTGA
jgi:hypothetical protein